MSASSEYPKVYTREGRPNRVAYTAVSANNLEFDGYSHDEKLSAAAREEDDKVENEPATPPVAPKAPATPPVAPKAPATPPAAPKAPGAAK